MPDIERQIIPEAFVIFDTAAGHNHDGTNSRGITGSSVDHSTLANLNWAAAGHTIDADIDVLTTNKVTFRDAAIFLNSSVDGQLDIDADVEVEITAPTIDLNGVVDVSGDLVTASDIDMATGKSIGIADNELITFNAAGTIAISGAGLTNTVANGENNIGLIITQNDTTNNPNAVNIINPGTGDALFIDTNAAIGRGIFIDTEAQGDIGLRIDADALTNGSCAIFDCNSANFVGTAGLLLVRIDNVGASGVGIKVQNDGTGTALVIDQNGAGIPLDIDQATLTDTNFKKMIVLETLTVWISDGTTAEGALTGVEGDICLNGGTGNGQTAYCNANGTNWTGM